MKTIEARAIISAKDATGMVFNAIAAKIAKLNTAASAASKRAGSASVLANTASRAAAGPAGMGARAGGAAKALGGVAGGVMGVGGLGVAGAAYYGVQSVKRYAETDLALTRIGITADATDKEVAGLQNNLRDLAFASGKSFGEISKGLDSLVAGGLDLNKALPAIPAITRTAQAAGAQVEDMATTALALNQALGISTDKMQSSFDMLVTGGKAGKFELKDMARYMASILPAAKAVGMQGEDGLAKIVALMQTVRQGTGTTEEAASSIQNIFAKMESEETTKKFTKFGVDLRKEMKDARASGKDLLQTFVEMTNKATKGDISKIPQLFSDMEMARGMRALMQYGDTFKDVMDRLKTSAGSSMGDLDKVLKRPQIALDRLSESWDRLKVSAGAALDAIGASKGMQKTAEILEGMGPDRLTPEERQRSDAEKKRQDDLDQKVKSTEENIAEAEKDAKSGSKSWLPIIGPNGIEKRGGMDSPALQRLRAKASEARTQMAVPAQFADPSSIFNEKEIETMQEVDRERRRGEALSSMNAANRARRPGIPTPERDPRKSMPGPDPIDNIMNMGPIKTELTGSAEVTGETTVKVEVTVNPSGQLLEAVAKANAGPAKMSGRLDTSGNGPGSVGKSSPDAGAPSRGGSSGAW